MTDALSAQVMIGRSMQVSVSFFVQAASTVKFNARTTFKVSSDAASARYVNSFLLTSGSNVM